MLCAGFDPQQHPLLSVIVAQQRKALERAKRSVRASDVWSLRGLPEPRSPRLELHGHQVFFMVPVCEDASGGGWRALTGRVVINYSADRDPMPLRIAEAVDSEALREKCYLLSLSSLPLFSTSLLYLSSLPLSLSSLPLFSTSLLSLSSLSLSLFSLSSLPRIPG